MGELTRRTSEHSFGARLGRIDGDDPESLLRYLDAARGVRAVREAKLRATDAMELRAGDRLLDLGAGAGADALEMLERVLPGGHVTAVDASPHAVAEAAARFADRPADAVLADAHALPFAAGCFDACR